MRITQSEQDARRNRMIHTAYSLYCEFGIDAVTFERIAKEAGLSRNSVFRYFSSKAELVQCAQIILWQEIATYILKSNKAQRDSAKSGLEKVRILLYGFKTLYENHSNYLLFAYDYKLFLMHNHISMSELQYKQMLRSIFAVFQEALCIGQQDGSIDKSKTAQIHFLVMWGILRGFVEEIVVFDKIYAGENPWKDQFDLVLKLILDGMQTPR